MTDIDATLQQRGGSHGNFVDNSRVAQQLKNVMRGTPNWDSLSADQKEALDMSAHKTARILCGDPNFHDHWHDIIGYTKLIADRLDPNDK